MPKTLPRKLPANPAAALFTACRDGDDDTARRLVELGASFAEGRAGEVIVTRGSEAMFELALAHGLPLTGDAGRRVLEAAIRRGHVARLDRLLGCGAGLASVTLPLHVAVQRPLPGEEPVAPTAREAVIDLLIRHGASVDAASPTMTVLGSAIWFGDMRAAQHLLDRGASVATGVELAEAFRRGMIPLARSLAARGAPLTARSAAGWTIDAVVAPDLVTPVDVDVRYRMSSDPQRVRTTIRLACFEPVSAVTEPMLRRFGCPLTRLAEVGLAGSAGAAQDRGTVQETSCTMRVSADGFAEVTQDLVVRSVSPAMLALAVRSLVHGALAYPASVRVHGELEPTGEVGSVASERARAWFTDSEQDALALPDPLPFTVEHVPEPGLLVRVGHVEGSGQHLTGVLVALNEWLPLCADPTRSDTGKPHVAVAITPGKQSMRGTSVRAQRVAATASLDGEPEHLEAIRTLVLAALAGCDGVEHVTWCLDPSVA